MAEIVLGIGTSHSPTLSLPPDLLPVYAERDRTNPMLSAPPDGKVRTYEELLEIADPSISERVNDNLFRQHHEIIQRDIAELARSLEEANPDTVIIVGDDQEELFFDDNMPSLSIYWGESIRLIPRGRQCASTPPSGLPPGDTAMSRWMFQWMPSLACTSSDH